MKPDRVVVGARREAVFQILGDLYQPYLRTDKPLLTMSPESAEMTKYAANCLLATQDQLHQRAGQSLRGHGGRHQRSPPRHRPRQPHRLRLPLSRRRLRRKLFSQGRPRAGGHRPRRTACSPRMLDAVHEVNVSQKTVLVEKIRRHFGDQLSGPDRRRLGAGLQAGHRRHPRGAGAGADRRPARPRASTLKVHDPEAMENVRRQYGDRLTYCHRRDDALVGADALAIMTEWKHFVHPDFERDAAADAAAGRFRRPQSLSIRSG